MTEPNHTPSTWYEAISPEPEAVFAALNTDIAVDYCIIGGGFTGIEAAHRLALAEPGAKIAILEKNQPGAGASGRCGGHLDRGFAREVDWIRQHYGFDMAASWCEASVTARDRLVENIKTYGIKCDLRFGHVTAALKPSQMDYLKSASDLWAQFGHDETVMLDEAALKDYVISPHYIGGTYNPRSGHLHPLAYIRGMARAVTMFGVSIFGNTAAMHIDDDDRSVTVTTSTGHKVKARRVIVAGDAYLGDLSRYLTHRMMTFTAHMIATSPLDDATMASCLPQPVAAYDASFIMNYYRPTSDNRLLFGGTVSYADASTRTIHGPALMHSMLRTFPQLAQNPPTIAQFWSGKVGMTLNRMPDIGRLSPNVFYGQGYSGHGINVTHLAADMLSDAARGNEGALKAFGDIRHLGFPGGALFRRPALVLGMAWFRLKDALS